MIIPAALSEDDHLRCAYSRVSGRFPTLSYFNKRFGFAIWRGSQPAYDTQTTRSKDDEKYIMGINSGSEQSQQLLIFNPKDKKLRSHYPVENPKYYERVVIESYNMAESRPLGLAFE